MSFSLDDAGRSLSKRPGQRNDCVIRAIALVLERDYDEVYDVMKELGRKAQRGTLNRVWTSWLLSEGAERLDFEEAPTLREFLLEFSAGRFVVHIQGHALAILDGVVHDLAPIALRSKVKGAFEWPVV